MPRQQYSRELKVATMRELDAGKSMAQCPWLLAAKPISELVQ
ncbi:MAG: hypothetical protein WB762_35130 [Candidatus Sulfotelmatobacter sp.]